jgi:hypothetical protein
MPTRSDEKKKRKVELLNEERAMGYGMNEMST